MKRLSPTAERLLAAGCLGVAFLVMASVFNPDRSRASNFEMELDQPAPEIGSTDPHASLESLGSLETERYHVEIYSSDTGPRYTVIDKATDNQLGVLLDEQDMQRWFPDIQIPTSDFSVPPISSASIDPMP
jgi:hypothetical protein